MDKQQIDMIVAEVLRRLRGGQPQAGRSSAPVAAPQPVSSRAESAEAKPAPKIFITEDLLRKRLAGTEGTVVELAHNEHLTPAAQDLIARRRLTVRRAPAPSPARQTAQPATTGNPTPSPQVPANSAPAGSLGLILERPSEGVQGLLSALAADGLELTDYTQTDCWMRNLQGLCSAVTSGTVSAGVALLPYAADAMVLANKIPGIRAVQGTRPDSVGAAVRRFGANLLVIEHAFSSFFEMRTMVRLFAAERTAPKYQALMDTLATLES
ncbi:MAG: RpiB/LacA/LacB family sugar-phosphate isomerase [Phycisphaerae bacterium]